ELFDDAEHVVPAARVEPRHVLAQLPEDLVHLEGGEDGLDQHRRADRAALEPERVLAVREDVVPEPRLEVALELRQVEPRAGAALEQGLAVVEDVEAEVEQAPAHGLAVDEEMPLGKVPAAWADEQRRRLVVEAVGLVRGLE